MQAQRKGFRQGFSMFPWLRLFIIALTSAAYWIVLRWALQSRARRVATDGSTCSKEAMIKWATSHGVQAHKMAIGEFAYEDHLAEGDYWLDSIRLRRGLLAVESISEGEVLVSLPWRSCITTEHLRASQHPLAGMVANEQDKTLEQHEMLALFLLYEYHQPNSAWAPYLCMLPRKLTSPIFWPTSMLGMIPSGPLLEQTLALKKTLAQRFEETVAPAVGRYKSVFPADVLTLPNFLWAIGTVKARNWGMSWKGKTLSFLAPLADLVNHHSLKGGGAHLSYLSTPAPPGEQGRRVSSRSQGVWVDVALDGEEHVVLELISGANYSRGQEVFISYGRACKEQLLLNYGFSDTGPSHPCAWDEGGTYIGI